MNDRILKDELLKLYNVEPSFFDELVDCGLLPVVIEKQETYLVYDDLKRFEQLTSWHYDLDINIPGLEVIHRMLEQMNELKTRNTELLAKLNTIGSGKI